MFLPVFTVFSSLLSFGDAANILGVGTIPSISHQVVFHPIWRELSLRGHQVTVVTPNLINDPELVNLTEIDISDSYTVWDKYDIPKLSSKNVNRFVFIPQLYDFLHALTEYQLELPAIKRLLNDDDQKFDVILLETYYPAWQALVAKYNAPIIGISSLGLNIAQYDSVGNPTHPILYPDFYLTFHENYSLLKKIESCLYTVWVRLYNRYHIIPQADKLARKHFGNHISYVGELDKNISLWFLGQIPLLHPPRPNVPAIIQLGQLHMKPAKPLPKDLQDVLDSASEGVVYFSLGSNVKSAGLSTTLRNTILEALSELPFTVLWKWEDDQLPGKSKNIVTRKWLPQQDVLAHPNVKVFVTQGGLQSILEAMSRSVPMVGIPFMGDQPMNVQSIKKLGIAIGLEPNSLTKDQLKNAILDVAGNSQFKRRIKEVQNIVNDQPMTSLETAVWWTEYVIRHKGARHLRSPTVDMPWYYYCLLDVIGAVIVVIVVIIMVLKFIVEMLLSSSCKSKLKEH